MALLFYFDSYIEFFELQKYRLNLIEGLLFETI